MFFRILSKGVETFPVNPYRVLEQLTSERWTGLGFSLRNQKPTTTVERICEAISNSFRENLTLSVRSVKCQGALRCLGVQTNDQQMVDNLTLRTGMTVVNAMEILSSTPTFDVSIRSVKMGRIESPDILISYLLPENAMQLLRQWQIGNGGCLTESLSAFMALCTAMVTAMKENRLVFSLGCPDSRRFGGIPSDRIIAVIPREQIHKLNPMEEKNANL